MVIPTSEMNNKIFLPSLSIKSVETITNITCTTPTIIDATFGSTSLPEALNMSTVKKITAFIPPNYINMSYGC